MVSIEHHQRQTENVVMATPSDGIGATLRILCPACHEALPEEILMLVKMLEAVPDRVSSPGSIHPPRP
jgi:hypothetical protein